MFKVRPLAEASIDVCSLSCYNIIMNRLPTSRRRCEENFSDKFAVPVVDTSTVIEYSNGTTTTADRERVLYSLLERRHRLVMSDPVMIAAWQEALYPSGGAVSPDRVAEGLDRVIEAIDVQMLAYSPTPINPNKG